MTAESTFFCLCVWHLLSFLMPLSGMGTGHPLVSSSSLLRSWWCTKLDKMSQCLPAVTQTVWLYMFFKFSLLDLDQLQSWIFLEENQGSLGVRSVPLTMLLLPYELTFSPLFVKLCSPLWGFRYFLFVVLRLGICWETFVLSIKTILLSLSEDGCAFCAFCWF